MDSKNNIPEQSKNLTEKLKATLFDVLSTILYWTKQSYVLYVNHDNSVTITECAYHKGNNCLIVLDFKLDGTVTISMCDESANEKYLGSVDSSLGFLVILAENNITIEK